MEKISRETSNLIIANAVVVTLARSPQATRAIPLRSLSDAQLRVSILV